MKKEKIEWNLKRQNEFQYTLPADKFSEVKEYTLDVSDSKKRLIYAMSDLHIGGHWSDGMSSKLNTYLQSIMAKAKDEVRKYLYPIYFWCVYI